MANAELAVHTATLEKFLKQSNHQFTLNDATAFSGLRTDQAKEALNALMETYLCRLKMTENGDLIYDFGKTLHRRGQKTFGEIVAQIGEALWKAFTFIYKIWITLMLVVYFIIFLVILILMVVAILSGSNDKNKKASPNLGKTLNGMTRALFNWSTVSRSIIYTTDKRGYRHKAYQPRPSSVAGETQKSFIAKVYDFVFGPLRVTPAPGEQEREIAAYIRANKGLLVAAEVRGLTGFERDKADFTFSDSLIRFNGEPRISEKAAVLYGYFFELIRSVSKEHEGQIIWFWDEYEPPFQITGNTTKDNAIIIGMNLFNLCFALFALLSFAQTGYFFIFEGREFEIFLGWVPAVFSVIFFAVPLLRSMPTLRKERERKANNIKKRVMKVIFQHRKVLLTLDFITQKVNETQGQEEHLSAAVVGQTMETLLYDLEGERVVNAEGVEYYAFVRFNEELDEIRELRRHAQNNDALGKITFETD
jgi:hypothetical protein